MCNQKQKGKVLVTGGAGCVGSILMELLVKEGYNVLSIDKETPKFTKLNGVKFLKGDMSDKNFILKCVEGADYVINTAAIVDISKSFDELAPVNFFAVQNLYEVSKTQGVKLFIHLSTGALYRSSSTPLKEDSPVEAKNSYEKTKLMADSYLLSQTEESPVINILRPALIFGPRGKVLLSALATAPVIFKLFTDKIPQLKGGPKSNLVHAIDVARAVVFLIENPQKHREIFNVANDDIISFGDMLTIAFRSYGIKITERKITLPSTTIMKIFSPFIARDFIFKLFNGLTYLFWVNYMSLKSLPVIIYPRLDKVAMDFSVRDTIFDNSKLKSLGFTYSFPTFEMGWKETVDWYISAGWIPAP